MKKSPQLDFDILSELNRVIVIDANICCGPRLRLRWEGFGAIVDLSKGRY